MSDLIPVLGIKPPAVSPYLQLTPRSPADVLLARLAPPLWIVVITPRNGESYIPEMPLNAMRNERSALNVLKESNTDGGAMVLNVLEDGRVVDVSEDFARQYAQDMRRDGWDAGFISRIGCIRQWLSEDEIEEIR